MRKITPRPYQKEAVDSVIAAYDKGYPGALVRLPTGCGKTITAGLAAQRWLEGGDRRRVFILCHETQLVHQFAREMGDVLQMPVAIEQSQYRVGIRDKPRVVVASRASLTNKVKIDDFGTKHSYSRLKKFDPADEWLVIVDEAHRYSRRLKTCGHVFEHFEANQNSRRLGITATPWRTDGISLESLFPYIACDLQLIDVNGGPSAVSEGWCVPYVNKYVIVQGVDFARDIRTTGGDFDEESLAEVLAEGKVLASLVEPTLDIAEGRRTLIFNPTTAMAKKVRDYINTKLGWEACKSLDGSVPHEQREVVYKAHRSNQFQFLSVCGLCREGYDDPGIQAVAIFRPTKSTSLAEQMKGRGCRPLPGLVDGKLGPEERLQAIATSPKPNALIIDLVGVTGLEGAASAARCYASGEPDDIIGRAEKIMLDGETDVKVAVDEAKKQAAAEEAEKRKKLKEEEEKREACRIAMLEARTKYKVSGAAPGVTSSMLLDDESASPKQIGYLRWIRLSFNERLMTKRQASKFITMHRCGTSVANIQKQVDKWELSRLSKL